MVAFVICDHFTAAQIMLFLLVVYATMFFLPPIPNYVFQPTPFVVLAFV